MSNTFTFYADAGLTVSLDELDVTQVRGGAPRDRLIYFGSAEADKQLEAASAPGIDPIVLSVADDDEEGGLPATAVALALSAGGLDTATPGDPLTLGVTLLSGSANATPVYVRIDAGEVDDGDYTDLALALNGVTETDV